MPSATTASIELSSASAELSQAAAPALSSNGVWARTAVTRVSGSVGSSSSASAWLGRLRRRPGGAGAPSVSSTRTLSGPSSPPSRVR